MRARPNLSGEQIVTDYMTRVAQAARLLPKGARMAFVGRTRALVEREVGPPGTRTDPEQVTAVLDAAGQARGPRHRGADPDRPGLGQEPGCQQGGGGGRGGGPYRAADEPPPEGTAAAQLRYPAPDRQADPSPGRTRPSPARTAPSSGPRRRPQARGPAALRAARPQAPRTRTGPRSAGPGSGDSRDAGPRRLRSADSPDPGPQGAAPPGAAPQGTATQGTSQRGAGRRGHRCARRRAGRRRPHRPDRAADRAGPGQTRERTGPRRSPRAPASWPATTSWRASPSCCSVLAG